MGAESYIYLTTGTVSFVSRADPHLVFHVGADAELPVFNSKAHFFDGTTEKRIG